MKKIAITGLEAHFGDYPNRDAFAHALYLGEPITKAEGDIAQLLQSTIEGALADAQVGPGERVEVVAVAEPSLAESVFAAFPAHQTRNVPPHPQAVFQALEDAGQRLAQGEVDVVVLGAGGDIGAGALALGVDAGPTARAQGYAVVQAAAPPAPRFRGEDKGGSPQHLGNRGEDKGGSPQYWGGRGAFSPSQVGYLEFSGPEILSQDPDEVKALCRAAAAWQTPTDDLTCALGSIHFNGDAPVSEMPSPAAEMASLIKTALTLAQRFLPASPGWGGPKNPPDWESSPFYILERSRFWFTGEDTPQRLAAIYAPSPQGKNLHILLSEHPHTPHQNRFVEDNVWKLIPLAAEDQAQLITSLQALQESLDAVSTPAELGELTRRFAPPAPRFRGEDKGGSPQHWGARGENKGGYTLALVGEGKDGLLREIDLALEGVPKAFQEEKDWHTPRGSYFTTRPLKDGKIAFVYPGAFNAYPNAGRDIFHLFPGLYDYFAPMTSHVGDILAERLLYPRSLEPLSRSDWRAQELRILEDPIAIIESGIAFSMLYTTLIRDHFHITPNMALGYSLGENSMFWAAEIWKDMEEGSQAWRDSDLFRKQLSGPKVAVREHWGDYAKTKTDAELWKTYILMARREDVEALVNQEEHVYLTIINTPREVVIAGGQERCEHVINELGCHSLQVPYDAVLHAPPGGRVHDDFVGLYTHPTHPTPNGDIKFYSAAKYAPLEVESDTIGQALSTMTHQQVDFQRLVNTAYEDGARIFIELGPRRTCSRWISKILGSEPHIAVPINKKGQGDIASLLGVLAKLLSHGVPVDLAPLAAPGEDTAAGEEKPVPQREADAGGEEKPAPQREADAGGEVTPPPSVESQPAAVEPLPLAPVPQVRAASASAAASHNLQIAELHSNFLAKRQAALRSTAGLIQEQTSLYAKMLRGSPPPLFDEADIQEFARGSITKCFGPDFAAFEGRRLPRIPNRELRLLSRILKIEGERGQKSGATLVSEFDVSPGAWFFRQNAYPTVPYAVYMEMGLQPCGFLTVYLGSILAHPQEDFYFRNLDGWAKLHAIPDLRGGKVRGQAKLLSTSVMKGVILQNFAFQLSNKGKVFYEGESSFGYFDEQTMKNQKGLDGGKSTQPWYARAGDLPADVVNLRREDAYYSAQEHSPHYRLSRGKLDFLDEVQIIEEGGRYGKGYIHAAASITPESWFFSRHFYQDPVMPGSLGVEAVLQAFQAYALRQGLGRHLDSPHFTPLSNCETSWKYRGQLTPENGSFHLEVHLSDVEVEDDYVRLVGDASLWKGDVRIYEMKGVGSLLVG